MRSRLQQLLGLLCALLVIVGCEHSRATSAPTTRPTLSINPAEFGADKVVVVHYHRIDEDYAGWNLWTWTPGQPGKQVEFTGTSEFGRYAVVPVSADRAGFIVRKGDWQQKDVDHDRFVDAPADNVREVWLVSGDDKVYADPAAIDLRVKLAAAFLDMSDRVTLAVTGKLSDAQVKSLAIAKAPPIASVKLRTEQGGSSLVYDVQLERPIDPANVGKLTIAGDGFDARPVYARDVLDEKPFAALDAKLGPAVTPRQATVVTWSPVAEKVELVLFEKDKKTGEEKIRTVPLGRGPRGLWSTSIGGDHHGTPYLLRFTSYGKERTVPDIYAHAATSDSSRSVLVDLDRLRPDGWGTVVPPTLKQPTDEIIYEMHVRDYTIADDAVPQNLRGTYLGMLTRNPAKDGHVSTGLDHLLDLGVTAIHLLPIQDFTAKVGEYNWGYWTALFNVPESNYSTDPADPMRAIVDLRQTVQTMHANGLRVILDVVYNHTSSTGEWSPFDQTVPYYYHRTTPDGRWTNDAGVGNSMADERAMVRKYIVDSVLFWAREYRIDGFRFDLIGTHTPETVRAVTDAIVAERPDVTLYGEPWTGGGPVRFGKGAQRGLRMAVFNDNFRGALRGDLDGDSRGFVSGSNDDASVERGIAGAIDDFTTEPIETVNYVSAHDNLTFWDKLVRANPGASDSELRAKSKLAHAIVLTSQGIPFLHGGCEFARTKGGNANSYNAGDEVNKFDWQRKQQYVDLYDYTRGLIALRKAHAAFRMNDDALVRRNLKFLDTPPGLIAYTLDGREVNDASFFVAINGTSTSTSFKLPAGEWDVLVNASRAGVDAASSAKESIAVPAWSMVVLRGK
jgi:pullulanase